MYLFFDTETTGLPLNPKAPIEFLDNWPRLVQIAWLLYNDSEKCIGEQSYLIKPNGFIIPKSATKIHGITTRKALSEGTDLIPVLRDFSKEIKKSHVIIAHNMFFDEKIVAAEFLRNNIRHSLKTKNKICTMQSSTSYCKIPGKYGNYKWPNLNELHYKLFKKEIKDVHNALADVKACSKCFFKLKKQGVIKI